MAKLVQSALLAAILAPALAQAAAQRLTGTVTNGTTNKPAADDEVILITQPTAWTWPAAPRQLSPASSLASFW